MGRSSGRLYWKKMGGANSWSVFEAGRRNEKGDPYCVVPAVTEDQAKKIVAWREAGHDDLWGWLDYECEVTICIWRTQDIEGRCDPFCVGCWNEDEKERGRYLDRAECMEENLVSVSDFDAIYEKRRAIGVPERRRR